MRAEIAIPISHQANARSEPDGVKRATVRAAMKLPTANPSIKVASTMVTDNVVVPNERVNNRTHRTW